jgi:thioredoxin-like negative regulator of GroEL
MSTEWINRLSSLQQTLTVCPTDGSTRCELASLLERLNQPEDALIHWKTVLAADPNSLQAREGIARCLVKTGRPLQSPL